MWEGIPATCEWSLFFPGNRNHNRKSVGKLDTLEVSLPSPRIFLKADFVVQRVSYIISHHVVIFLKKEVLKPIRKKTTTKTEESNQL